MPDGIQGAGGPPGSPFGMQESALHHNGKMWLWIAAGVAMAMLGAIALLALRPTTVTVTPRVHSVVFDSSSMLIAYPAATASAGQLSYTTETLQFEDSEVVPARGTEQAQEKASGTITVYNEYSADPIRLIKNTRFQTPGGLIFRVPAEVVVPGRAGSSPGSVSVTVFADAPGEEYNVAAERFTLPGLRSSADMYAKVYARSDAPMSGGFSGERPAVAAAELEAARQTIRARLEARVREAMADREGFFVFPDLARISYESLAPVAESDGKVRIEERARAVVPLFPAGLFASAAAAIASADASEGSVELRPKTGLRARSANADVTPGLSPLEFSLDGAADIVWKVDTDALAGALAGREEAAFESILASFSSIESAHARIQPFWKSMFPADPQDIQIRIEEPSAE